MVDKLITINRIGGLILLLISVAGIFDTFHSVNQYGWIYEQTTIINENTYTDFVNNYAKLFSTILFLGFGLVFMINGSTLNSSISTTPLDSLKGITFPIGEPEYWFIEHSPADNSIQIGLGEYSIDFPLSVIKKESSE